MSNFEHRLQQAFLQIDLKLSPMFIRLLALLFLMIIIDLINHLGIKILSGHRKEQNAKAFRLKLYWGITIFTIMGFIMSYIIVGRPGLDYEKYRFYFLLFGIFLTFYFPRILFSHFVVLYGILRIFKKIFFRKPSYQVRRHIRKAPLFLKIGFWISISSSLLVIYGMTYGKQNFKLHEQEIYLDNLPKAFEGFRIAQFSDAHLGSFTNKENVIKGLQLLADSKSDMIVFTGDMVNNIADEMEVYIPYFQKIKPPYGKYAILGNHDMSDYVKWKAFDLKQEYIDKLIRYETAAGFDVLLNEGSIIRKGKDSIALLGVMNWGKPPFKKYGDLNKTLSQFRAFNTKILLSHDPSHWTEEVVPQSDIDLTLSGHTHGMQLGINIWGIRWSPIQYLYKHWFGIYYKGSQQLYVNPGFGFLGFPGRIGISPEITVFTLKNKVQ